MADKHMSRREILRNIGLVGVGAWAVPVLTSLPAHAATSKKKNPCKKIQGNCVAGFVQCGSCGSIGSFCFETLNKNGKDKGKTTCAEDFPCEDATQCDSLHDCAKGQVCTTNGNCTGCVPIGGFCSPRCKGGSIRHGARMARPASRRTMASV
jgi:hypothetical protein